ncbi:MAG: pyrroline-5-carboxylate reductase [Planctomycetota bacterium]|jgi:pyrroline-5-carboxylate reductase
MLDQSQLAIIGLGTMGRALAKGLLEAGAIQAANLRASVLHAANAERLSSELPFEVQTSNVDAAAGSQVLLLCVKPKSVVAVMSELAAAGALDHAPLVVSIAAGVSTQQIEEAAGGNLRVVRAMPNTPCLVQKGMTVVSPGKHATELDIELALSIFKPLGRALALDEEHMDAVTGLSASGPAFVYVIIDALAEGGVMVGLPRKIAQELASQMVLGASTMVLETGLHPAELKDQVTTPAGCTISALMSLEDGKLRSVLARGVQEATRAASALGKN